MKATRDALGDLLPIKAEKWDNIIALDADLGKATKLASFKDKYPDRFFQIGIAEANMIGIASGLSEYGYKVFMGSFASFLTGRYDIIRCSIAYPNRPVVLVGTHVGMAIGKDGVTQMGLEDVSLMRAMPNMTILNPCCYAEALKCIDYLCDDPLSGPHYLRLGRQPVQDRSWKYSIHRANIIKGNVDKSDITIFSTGCVLDSVLEAAGMAENILNKEIRVVNITTLKPFNKEVVSFYAATTKGDIFTVEDHSIIGGLGSAVLEAISENCPKKVYRLGLKDEFPESAPPNELYEKYGLSPKGIAAQIIIKNLNLSYTAKIEKLLE